MFIIINAYDKGMVFSKFNAGVLIRFVIFDGCDLVPTVFAYNRCAVEKPMYLN
jgi:hypothetical protein